MKLKCPRTQVVPERKSQDRTWEEGEGRGRDRLGRARAERGEGEAAEEARGWERAGGAGEERKGDARGHAQAPDVPIWRPPPPYVLRPYPARVHRARQRRVGGKGEGGFEEGEAGRGGEGEGEGGHEVPRTRRPRSTFHRTHALRGPLILHTRPCWRESAGSGCRVGPRRDSEQTGEKQYYSAMPRRVSS
jgi:hypothetical protein